MLHGILGLLWGIPTISNAFTIKSFGLSGLENIICAVKACDRERE